MSRIRSRSSFSPFFPLQLKRIHNKESPKLGKTHKRMEWVWRKQMWNLAFCQNRTYSRTATAVRPILTSTQEHIGSVPRHSESFTSSRNQTSGSQEPPDRGRLLGPFYIEVQRPGRPVLILCAMLIVIGPARRHCGPKSAGPGRFVRSETSSEQSNKGQPLSKVLPLNVVR